MGHQKANFVKISVSDPSALGLKFLIGSHPFFPVAAWRSPWPIASATWGSDVELEAMESEQTGLAFLCLSHLTRTCAQILLLNSRTIIYILARRHVTPSPLD